MGYSHEDTMGCRNCNKAMNYWEADGESGGVCLNCGWWFGPASGVLEPVKLAAAQREEEAEERSVHTAEQGWVVADVYIESLRYDPETDEDAETTLHKVECRSPGILVGQPIPDNMMV